MRHEGNLLRKELDCGLMTRVQDDCPGCGAGRMYVFYEIFGVPAHSVLLFESRREAVEFPRGDIRLAWCAECGFIANLAYDPARKAYSGRCEETQGFSGTFNSFARTLAADIIERHGLRGKDIIEIGCGKGEFLRLLCEMGGNRGVGFDPAFVPERDTAQTPGVSFITDFYSEKYSHYRGDLIVCKMTLEHIHDAGRFLGAVRRSIGAGDTALFIQVPDVTRILNGLAFWDIYYEHCSYFSPSSLRKVLATSGFSVTGIRTDYGGQYIIAEAVPAAPGAPLQAEAESIHAPVTYFAENNSQLISLWKKKLAEMRSSGYRVALWGSGSKGVAFLTTLVVKDEIEYVVDINPYRQGTYMAGTGHEIVSPSFLKAYRPDAVIIMNPVYREEIERELAGLGVDAEIMTL